MSSQRPEDFLLVALCLKDVFISLGFSLPRACFKNLGSTGSSFSKAFLTKANLGNKLKHQGTGPRNCR